MCVIINFPHFIRASISQCVQHVIIFFSSSLSLYLYQVWTSQCAASQRATKSVRFDDDLLLKINSFQKWIKRRRRRIVTWKIKSRKNVALICDSECICGAVLLCASLSDSQVEWHECVSSTNIRNTNTNKCVVFMWCDRTERIRYCENYSKYLMIWCLALVSR